MLPLLLSPKIWLTIDWVNKDIMERMAMMKLAFFRFFFYFSA
ncbi:pheST operon leader peptide PheM [Xenorhabdus bovienii]|uniref:pheST attenuator peptide n=2 Tax=Xenorhabdus TaxID=626 RepID=A0AAJ1J6W3_XENBV|nr:pheST operon leader peptide PheM [Xenorhabdus bovienii]MDE1477337.1 pheST operon leader peptide PheM [Xenorhabdus bovienii]MDE1481394.1 pheST operon leader peptide PheM [Xenorhabdus bovienii]MDE1487902.1 pheST operon leader peptide PheM [Xenorhabdus bovienii]MDE1492278.1 pheST operon leader peptide PheM [Xenorhabdus bovienii]